MGSSPSDRGPLANSAAPSTPLADHDLAIVLPRLSHFQGFPLLCNAIFLAAFAWFYGPHLLNFLGIMILVALLVVPGTITLFARTIGPARKIAIRGANLHVDRKVVPLDEIREVRKARLRNSFAVLIVGPKKKRLRLPPHPNVFRVVLPELLRRRSEVVVSPHARRALDAPDALTTIPRWTAFGFLGLAGFLVLIPLLVRQADMRLLGWAFLLGMLLPSLGASIGTAPAYTREQGFLVSSSIGFLPPWLAFWCHLWSTIPLYAFDALAAMALVFCLAALLVAGFRLKLGITARAVILALAVIAPVGVCVLEAPAALGTRDVTRLFGQGRPLSPLVWSSQGDSAADFVADGEKGEQQTWFDSRNLRAQSLPLHKGFQIVEAVGRTHVVRTACAEGKRELYLYRLTDGQEVRLSEGKNAGVWGRRCLSPDGKHLCWMESAGNESDRRSLMVCDLDTAVAQPVDVAWPELADIQWSYCGWRDDRTLGVLGFSPPATQPCHRIPQTLHVLRTRYPEGGRGRWATTGKCSEWNVSPDMGHAFAMTEAEGNRPRGITYINLDTSREVFLGGSEFPAWEQDGPAAFRVQELPGKGQWLCRFDAGTAQEQPVLRIPDKASLESLSPHGRFAVLRSGHVILRPLSLVNLATGEQRRMEVSLFQSLFAFGFANWESGFTRTSLWSSDETGFLMQSVGYPGPRWLFRRSHQQSSGSSGEEYPPIRYRTHLCFVPEEWLRPDSSGPATTGAND